MPAHLTIDNAALDRLLKSPGGPVVRDLIRRVDRFQVAARHSAPRKTGCLEASILKRLLPGGGILVISDTSPCSPDHKSYSLFVHEGTAPHVITPKKAKVLSFVIDGERVFTMEVNHPGTAPRRFLTDNLAVLA